jgi:AraC family transcriptional regulator
VRVTYRYIRPVTVLYARGTGRYETAAREAWENLHGWLVARSARRHIRRGFGIFRDNPQVTACNLLRYDACVELTPAIDADPEAGIGRQVLGGGTHAIHTHVGSYNGLGDLLSELHRDFVPRQGLTVDYDRPFMAIHLNDPLMTREMHRRTELCVPVMPLPLAADENSAREEPSDPLRFAG